jgi:hypothetical protein
VNAKIFASSFDAKPSNATADIQLVNHQSTHLKSNFMKKFITSSLVLMFCFPLTGHAQFGGLLKDLKELKGGVEELLKNDQQQQKKNVTQEPPVSNANYCQRVTNNKDVQGYAALMREAHNKKATLSSDSLNRLASNKFDNPDRSLTKAVRDRLSKSMGNDHFAGMKYLSELNKIIGECAKSNVDIDLFYFFALNPNRDIDSQREDMRKNGLGYGGSAVAPRDRIDLDSKLSSYWASLYALNFDETEKLAGEISPPNLQALKSAITEEVASDIRHVESQKKRAEQEAAKAAADQKKREEFAAFEASPEGQLLYSYQHFQIVQLCHDLRRGLAIQFVTNNEISEFKTKMKQVESKLKGSLTGKNTDKIWQSAEGNNRNFGAVEIDGEKIKGIDLISTITNNNKTNWTSAKADCDLQTAALRDMFDEILGKENLKKSF